MQRAYATLDNAGESWQIHYRESGDGPPLVLLHPSPLSGAMLVPQIQTLRDRFRCIAWDTPGYGASDPLPASWSETTLLPYVRALATFLDALQLDTVTLYGSATGAQIAIEFAKAFPRRCRGLLLENVALFSEEEVQRLTQDYFPDLSPRGDGAHLMALWDMARRSARCFPWPSTRPEDERRSSDPPPAVIDAMVRDGLAAGPDYARAYRAAFDNERLEQLAAVAVPTRIIVWRDGILGEYGDRVATAALPTHIQPLIAAPGMDARMAALVSAAESLPWATTGDRP